MQDILIGRKKEQAVLKEVLKGERAELISVIGRRRVGKTFLVHTIYKEYICFEFAGVQNAEKEEQLENFWLRLNLTAKNKDEPYPQSNSWLKAFYQLIGYLETLNTNGRKKVVFFDELPWLDNHKSGFLNAFSVFWNSWASLNGIIVVICGSAASWMIQKVVNHKGGLHNRITKRIHLKPFTLTETAEYLKNNQIYLDKYQIVQIYMAMGGIPHYLKEIKSGQSAIQTIQEVCFSETGILQNEFSRLYTALFDNAERHIAIIRALASKHKGIVRKELVTISKLSSGGTFSTTLQELEQSGFISSYYPLENKKKEMLYRLTDEYSLFYLQFIENKRVGREDVWLRFSQTQKYKSWSGYAYENICLKHITQIKKALGISGIYSMTSSFYKKGDQTEKGTQIDLLIDRNDHVINLCEIKFYNTIYSIDKAYAITLREKMRIFQESTKTKKQLFWTIITTFGLKHNINSLGLIQHVLTLDDLFE